MAYASRTLASAEQCYSQIEEEASEVTSGRENFNYFVYATKIILKNEHRPLISISQKGSGGMPPRLERFFLLSLEYDFVSEYFPGKQFIYIDVLSWSSTAAPENDTASEGDI